MNVLGLKRMQIEKSLWLTEKSDDILTIDK